MRRQYGLGGRGLPGGLIAKRSMARLPLQGRIRGRGIVGRLDAYIWGNRPKIATGGLRRVRGGRVNTSRRCRALWETVRPPCLSGRCRMLAPLPLRDSLAQGRYREPRWIPRGYHWILWRCCLVLLLDSPYRLWPRIRAGHAPVIVRGFFGPAADGGFHAPEWAACHLAKGLEWTATLRRAGSGRVVVSHGRRLLSQIHS